MVQRLRRTVWRFLKKLKIELPYDPAISPLGIHIEKKPIILRDTYSPLVTVAPATIPRIWKQPRCSLMDV